MMQLGYIGLGKMGYNMVERLLEKKHEVVVYDRNQAAAEALQKRAPTCQYPQGDGGTVAFSPAFLDHGSLSGG